MAANSRGIHKPNLQANCAPSHTIQQNRILQGASSILQINGLAILHGQLITFEWRQKGSIVTHRLALAP